MKLFVLIFLGLFTVCFAQQTNAPITVLTIKTSVSETKNQPLQTKAPIEKRLERYFYKNEIRPLIAISNTKGNQTEIHLANNKIRWISDNKETKIKINNDLFTLEDKLSINSADEDRKINGYIANNWDEIKLFNFNGRKLIGIRMGNDPCTGLMCSVCFYLIYDLKTKSKNFFGTFRTEQDVRLFDFENDGTIDYLSTTYIGNVNSVEAQYVYELFTLDEKGNFNIQEDRSNQPYFIKRTFKVNGYEIVKEIDEKFEQNWIEKIN